MSAATASFSMPAAKASCFQQHADVFNGLDSGMDLGSPKLPTATPPRFLELCDADVNGNVDVPEKCSDCNPFEPLLQTLYIAEFPWLGYCKSLQMVRRRLA